MNQIEEWEVDEEDIDFITYYIFSRLKLLSQKEKSLLGYILLEGCPHDLPKNIHIDIQFLERLTNLDRNEISRCFKRYNKYRFRL